MPQFNKTSSLNLKKTTQTSYAFQIFTILDKINAFHNYLVERLSSEITKTSLQKVINFETIQKKKPLEDNRIPSTVCGSG